MENISSIIKNFKKVNPNIDDSIIIAHLKNLGYSDNEIEEAIENSGNTNIIIQNVSSSTIELVIMPDIDEPFDFPDDIKDDLNGRQ
ncbi:hypothetical protein [Arcicella rigui]|uniref:UBA domain-containing protein n=1 Tax=Arcicella rigui TaxID=797020 RepID=A0ABU5Q8Y9_9BACT|nr:hypothetical protein [Arcicella rigui]MEA5139042.1 hypothetical protein [Arcicella rigui]